MRTFEYRDDGSHRFWKAQLRGASVTLAYGKVGTSGQTQVRTFPDRGRARKEMDKLIAEKLKKGYIETQPVSKHAIRQQALEAALVAAPDDLALHADYAECLCQQGQGRGELIRVQLELEASRKATDRKRLLRREQELLRAQGEALLGELAGQVPAAAVRISRGWVEALSVGPVDLALVQALARAPQLRLLRELSVAATPTAGEDPVAVLLASPVLANLRVLRLGTRPAPAKERGALRNGHAGSHPPTALYDPGAEGWRRIAALPRLEELHLVVDTTHIEALFKAPELTRLRVLHLDGGNRFPLASLAGNRALAQLEELSLRPAARRDRLESPYLRLAEVRALLRSPFLPALRRLAIQQTALGDNVCEEIAASGILKRLEALDLSRGSITLEGARTLAECPELTHLQQLDLSCNSLTPAAVRRLKATGVLLKAGEQHDPEEDDYLFETQ